MVEFAECSSLSLTYDATGKVSVSLGVLRDDGGEINYSGYTSPFWGGESFNLVIMSASQRPIIGGTWHEWSLSMEGVTD